MRSIRLGELVKISGGGTPSRDTPEYFGGNIPWVTVKDFGDRLFLDRARESITPLGLASSASRLIPAGSVILVTRMTVGSVAINLVDVAINQDLKALQCCSALEPAYLLCFMLSKQKYLSSLATGATVKGITLEDIVELEIPLPEMAEQRRIAAILRAADDERRRRRYTQTLSDGLLGEVFVRLFGDPATNPMGWEVRKLGDFIEFVTSGSRGWAEHYSDSGAKFIRVQNLHDHRLDLSDIAYVRPPKGAEAERTRVQANDILLAITGATIGLCAMVPDEIGESYVSQHVAIIRLRTSIVPVFASSFVSHPRGGQLQIAAMNYGDTKPGLGLEQIRDLEIPCASLELQHRFAEVVAQHEVVRRQQVESAQQGDHLFETLLHRAFAGEL